MDEPTSSIFSGPITHLLSALCVFVKILPHASAKKKEQKKAQGFQISLLNPLFLSGQPRVSTQHHPRFSDETARDPHQRGQESEVSVSCSIGHPFSLFRQTVACFSLT